MKKLLLLLLSFSSLSPVYFTNRLDCNVEVVTTSYTWQFEYYTLKLVLPLDYPTHYIAPNDDEELNINSSFVCLELYQVSTDKKRMEDPMRLTAYPYDEFVIDVDPQDPNRVCVYQIPIDYDSDKDHYNPYCREPSDDEGGPA